MLKALCVVMVHPISRLEISNGLHRHVYTNPMLTDLKRGLNKYKVKVKAKVK